MLYLILKLTWDPKQNVDALLDDWCKAAVGEKAAPYLKKYYQGCSDFWEKEVPKTAFFKEKKQRQYLGRSSGYLDAVEPEWLDQMKQYLDKAVELATPERKACAEDIRKTFTSREQMIRTYVKNNKLRKEAEKMNFTEAKFYNFDKKNTMWATWQRNTSKGTFSFAPGEGVDNSGAIAMNLTKSYRDMVFMTAEQRRRHHEKTRSGIVDSHQTHEFRHRERGDGDRQQDRRRRRYEYAAQQGFDFSAFAGGRQHRRFPHHRHRQREKRERNEGGER